MVGMSIIWSIMLYPAGLMPYADALFFAAGMSTQSGLNTIDVNKLHLYQQVVMMLGTCICTPIFINTIVVFIRLYWFEKRFEHIVKDVRVQKRSKTRSLSSRSKSQMREHDGGEEDPGKLEQGVRGLPITVDTSTARFMDTTGKGEDTETQRQKFREKIGPAIGAESSSTTPGSSVERTDANSSSNATISVSRFQSMSSAAGTNGPISVSQQKFRAECASRLAADIVQVPVSPDGQDAETPQTSFMGLNPRLNREITFADEVPKSGRHSPDLVRARTPRDVSKHIEFLERQQSNAKKAGALYIPGPRDFDRGDKPEELDPDLAIQRQNTRPSLGGRRSTDDPRGRSGSHPPKAESHDEEHPRRGITINIPDHPVSRNRSVAPSCTRGHDTYCSTVAITPKVSV